MGDTKIKIDLSSGVIEAEGNEQFVKSIYSDFKEEIKAHPPAGEQGPDARRRRSPKKNSKKKKARKSKPTKDKTKLKLVKNLDLSKKGSTPSLKDFYQQYNPKTNMERNIVFCYYLQALKKITPITVNHIYTCYRNIRRLSAPIRLYQSIIDTARIKGWLDTSSMESITIEVAGTNWIIEHEKSENGES